MSCLGLASGLACRPYLLPLPRTSPKLPWSVLLPNAVPADLLIAGLPIAGLPIAGLPIAGLPIAGLPTFLQ